MVYLQCRDFHDGYACLLTLSLKRLFGEIADFYVFILIPALFIMNYKTENSFYTNECSPSHPGGPSPTLSGWFYIAYDYRHLDQTKIGITSRPIFDRIKESKTSNPCYTLFAAFHVPDKSILLDIEKYIFRKIYSETIRHLSGRESEWVHGSPSDIFGMVLGKIPNTLNIEVCPLSFEYDFTKTIYLPKINPYAVNLNIGRDKFEEFVRFSAPEIYLEELQNGYRRWDARPNFLSEVGACGQQRILSIIAPQILLDRFNYDLALRNYPINK